MTSLATARPEYIQQERTWKQEQEAKRAFEAYLRTEEGRAAEALGAEAVQMKRVLIKGRGISLQAHIRRGCECPYRVGSRQEKAWLAGFWDRAREEEMGYDL